MKKHATIALGETGEVAFQKRWEITLGIIYMIVANIGVYSPIFSVGFISLC
ncbi:hypothetical protein [Marivirga lumbricoides]|uniref:hypothetical protein n=1 Tax=Marivirga lumbricoides TaxID=1046115 RepID=UPI0016629E20